MSGPDNWVCHIHTGADCLSLQVYTVTIGSHYWNILLLLMPPSYNFQTVTFIILSNRATHIYKINDFKDELTIFFIHFSIRSKIVRN